jgi:hypothetical protein
MTRLTGLNHTSPSIQEFKVGHIPDQGQSTLSGKSFLQAEILLDFYCIDVQPERTMNYICYICYKVDVMQRLKGLKVVDLMTEIHGKRFSVTRL